MTEPGIQLTGATSVPTSGNYVVRRLPPLTAVYDSGNQSVTRRMSPAHIRDQEVSNRRQDGVATVLPGSSAIMGKAVYLGVPPQPAENAGDLNAVGRSTLRPRGRLPSTVASPWQGTVPRSALLVTREADGR